MLHQEETAVAADGVKILTTVAWSHFIQSIHSISGDSLMLQCWNGQYLFFCHLLDMCV